MKFIYKKVLRELSRDLKKCRWRPISGLPTFWNFHRMPMKAIKVPGKPIKLDKLR